MKKPVRLIALLVVLLGGGTLAYSMTRPRAGYEPHQPIYFQHRRMAGAPQWTKDAEGKDVNTGGFNIPCLYCHSMEYKGRHATLPSTDICMNCHSTVGQSKEWVLVLQGYWERGEPIPWVKVHDLPDYVYYDHSVHLAAKNDQGEAKLDCVDCHGTVEEMDVVTVQSAFNMGWCLDCHRKPEMNAPTDCVTCHR
ncbi:MAG: cytochrome C [Deltaproteobacteria bacterium]|nr:MAG: cytochrome C [Deltaproteobacteria bacterium]